MKVLAGRTAFITGGASGIGLGIAKSLANEGMNIALTYRRKEMLEPALKAISKSATGAILPIELDITDRKALREAANEVGNALGHVHLVCNNAGVNLLGPMDEATHDDWDWILSVNLGGAINVLVEFLPRIKRHGEGGHVINIASMASFIAGPRYGVYATSKFALRGLSECLRYDLARHKIGVTLVCPGLTRSNIFDAGLRRPKNLSRTSVQLDASTINGLKAAHQLGMSPDEIGLRTVRALQRNEFYVFTHPEFCDEMREATDEILGALPPCEPDYQPERLLYERKRRKAKNDAKRILKSMDQ